jgi:hypothetical protein
MLVAATLAQRRYERELNRAERPIIRKVLEGDAVSSRLMVLFVADVIKPTGAPDAALMVEVRCGPRRNCDEKRLRLDSIATRGTDN